MKIALLMPKVTPGVDEAVAVRVTVEGTFLGLIDSPGKGGKIWSQQRDGSYQPEGSGSLALAFQVPSGTYYGSRRKLMADRSDGDVFYLNPCCIALDLDTGALLWSPRDHLDELGAEHIGWLGNYPEWAGDEVRDPRWLIALKSGISPGMMGMVNPVWSANNMKHGDGKAAAE